MVREITPISNYHMVHEKDAHDAASFLDALGKHIISLAGMRAIGWVIVSNCQDSGIVQNCLPHDSAHIYRRLRDTPMTHRHMLDKPKVLVHQKQMAFLHLQILHMRIKEIIDSQATAPNRDALPYSPSCNAYQALWLPEELSPWNPRYLEPPASPLP